MELAAGAASDMKAPNDTLYPVSAATEEVNSIQMVIYSKTGSYVPTFLPECCVRTGGGESYQM